MDNTVNGHLVPERIKPSIQIKQMVQLVARQRAEKASKSTGIAILGRSKEVIARLEADPMTWVMAILAFLDQEKVTVPQVKFKVEPGASLEEIYARMKEWGIDGWVVTNISPNGEVEAVNFQK